MREVEILRESSTHCKSRAKYLKMIYTYSITYLMAVGWMSDLQRKAEADAVGT